MSFEAWLVYLAACTAIAITPGPVILYAVQSSQLHGLGSLK